MSFNFLNLNMPSTSLSVVPVVSVGHVVPVVSVVPVMPVVSVVPVMQQCSIYYNWKPIPVATAPPQLPLPTTAGRQPSRPPPLNDKNLKLAAPLKQQCAWNGNFPASPANPSGYSCKVFLGGIPFDITEEILKEAFKPFLPISVDYPRSHRRSSAPRNKGFAYMTFGSELSVRALLQACSIEHDTGKRYYKIHWKKNDRREVAVVPWSLDEAVYAPITIPALPPEKTVYVKSLHKSLSARSLANIMEDVFENVIYAEISVDDLNYPTGSGIVTFGNLESYMKAVRTATININRYSWKIRIFPYMEDSPCSRCRKQQGPFFCSEFLCFRYFCNTCWHLHHNTIVQKHCALTKNSRERWTLGIPTLVS